MPRARMGQCGMSVYGSPMSEMVYEDETYFEDENFNIPHDRPGILTMINHGPHTNNSRFLVLTAPAPHLNERNVAFGDVVDGLDTLLEIDKVCGSQCGHPTHLVEIVQAGLLGERDDKLPESKSLEELNYVPSHDPLAYTKGPLYLE